MFEDYPWFSFGIAFVLLTLLPVWGFGFLIKGFFLKLLATIIMGVITFIAVAMKRKKY